MNKTVKKVLYILGGILVVLFIAYQGLMMYTKSHSPQETVTLNTGQVDISIAYSRPYKKEREIFGGLVPYDMVWRTGANEATIFTTSEDLKIGNNTLSAGSYTLWTIPRKDSWVVIFNSETGQWGVKGPSGEDNRDPANDVLTVKADVFPTGESVEQFTIALEDAEGIELVLSWDDVLVMVPIDML